MELLTDNSEMPFGKFKGQEMEDVPAAYLLFIWEEKKAVYNAGGKMRLDEQRVMAYIEDNLVGLEKEAKKSQKITRY